MHNASSRLLAAEAAAAGVRRRDRGCVSPTGRGRVSPLPHMPAWEHHLLHEDGGASDFSKQVERLRDIPDSSAPPRCLELLIKNSPLPKNRGQFLNYVCTTAGLTAIMCSALQAGSEHQRAELRKAMLSLIERAVARYASHGSVRNQFLQQVQTLTKCAPLH